jgi:P-type Ca2+ transporter type 2C
VHSAPIADPDAAEVDVARTDSRPSRAEGPALGDPRSPAGDLGLTSGEAIRRRERYGPNRTPAPRPRRLHTRVVAQLRDPMILLLLAAGTLTAALHDVSDSVIIGAVVLFNTVIGVVQEVRADRAIAALDALTTPTTRVIRDGLQVEVSSEDVVPGDLAALSAGDVVPADGVVAAAKLLEVDQSTMTGESVPVALVDGDEISGGTLVTRGRADVTITTTGADCGLGLLATMIASAPTRATPLQRRLTELSRVLVVAVGVLTGVVVVIGLLQHRAATEMAIVGVSLAVAAVPESLPAVVAVSLALGAHRMARRNAVVRRLPAVETLGSVTVIATDKTGTITEGRMVAERVWTPGGAYVVEAHGYEPSGSLRLDRGPTPGDSGSTRELDRLLRDVMLCNDARLVHDDAGWSVVGDPLEGALLTLARKGSHAESERDRDWMRVDEEPFDHLTRRMTTVHRDRDGAWLTVCKGAPEAVLALLPASDRVRRAADAAEELARGGYRVIAVADHEGDDGPTVPARSLDLVGLVAIDDPPRDHAAAVVVACRRAGIRLLLVTGDHPATARAIAERVGIASRGVDADPEDRTVFSRVRPEQKVAIVRTLQRDGEVVAMIGDGVNDAPALRSADIGVAAGRGGTEVARQAADLVLMDDDLSTVVSAVEEGRRIFANIRSFLLYAVSGGLAEVGVMLFGPALGIDQPLLPAQILWINLMTHGLTGVAFGSEPADPADMARPPRSPTQSVFTPRFSLDLALAGAALTITALTVGLLAGDEVHQRTSIFLTLGLGQLAVAWSIRARTRRRARRAPWLGAAIATAGALLLSATMVGPLQDLLRTTSLGVRDLVVALVAAVVPGVVVGFRIRAERKALLIRADPRSDDTASH